MRSMRSMAHRLRPSRRCLQRCSRRRWRRQHRRRRRRYQRPRHLRWATDGQPLLQWRWRWQWSLRWWDSVSESSGAAPGYCRAACVLFTLDMGHGHVKPYVQAVLQECVSAFSLFYRVKCVPRLAINLPLCEAVQARIRACGPILRRSALDRVVPRHDRCAAMSCPYSQLPHSLPALPRPTPLHGV